MPASVKVFPIIIAACFIKHYLIGFCAADYNILHSPLWFRVCEVFSNVDITDQCPPPSSN